MPGYRDKNNSPLQKMQRHRKDPGTQECFPENSCRSRHRLRLRKASRRTWRIHGPHGDLYVVLNVEEHSFFKEGTKYSVKAGIFPR
jgi:DnaJ-class molecular chaperone